MAQMFNCKVSRGSAGEKEWRVEHRTGEGLVKGSEAKRSRLKKGTSGCEEKASP